MRNLRNQGNIWSSIKNSKTTRWVSGAIAVVLVALLIIAGIGLLPILLLMLLIGIVIYFGSIKELAESIVLGALLKMYIAEIKTILGFWTTSEGVEKTLNYIANTGAVNVIIVLFIFIFGVSALSGSIKLFNIRVNSNTTTNTPS